MLNILQVNPAAGLQNSELAERRDVFGTNMRAPHQTRGFCKIIWDALGDTLLRVLLVCGIISIIIDESTEDDKSIGISALPY